MKTGPTKESSRKLALMLEKKAKKSKKAIWMILSKGISKQRRLKREINIWQLNKLAKKFDGKILVTASKVLSFGNPEVKIRVAAPSFSKSALEKIRKNGGEAINLAELIESNYKEKDMVLVK